MTDYQFAVLMAMVVRVAMIGAGTTIVLMGFRLFTKGIQRGGAGVDGEAGNAQRGWRVALKMDRGGPGLVFALFGAIVLVVGIARESKVTSAVTNSAPNSEPGASGPTPGTTNTSHWHILHAPPKPPLPKTPKIPVHRGDASSRVELSALPSSVAPPQSSSAPSRNLSRLRTAGKR